MDRLFASSSHDFYHHWHGWRRFLSTAYKSILDFAGYSLMAIGLGLICGFIIFHAISICLYRQSITEFWRRWHMSLSRWFRDYVYIPLGGNRPLAMHALYSTCSCIRFVRIVARCELDPCGVGCCMEVSSLRAFRLGGGLDQVATGCCATLIHCSWFYWLGYYFRANDFTQAAKLIKSMFGFPRSI